MSNSFSNCCKCGEMWLDEQVDSSGICLECRNKGKGEMSTLKIDPRELKIDPRESVKAHVKVLARVIALLERSIEREQRTLVVKKAEWRTWCRVLDDLKNIEPDIDEESPGVDVGCVRV